MKQGPVLFYLHEHFEHNPELDTPVYRDLIERCDSAFLELVHNDQDEVARIEENWNACIGEGHLEHHNHFVGYKFITVVRSMVGSGRKVVLERSTEPDFDFNETLGRCVYEFFETTIERAQAILQECMEKVRDYQDSREEAVAEQIMALGGKPLVLFGAAHERLTRLVSEHREVEVHYPFPHYESGFFKQLYEGFRRNGTEATNGLAFKTIAELYILAAIRDQHKRWSRNEERVLAHHYADQMSTDQIIAMRDASIRERDATRKAAEAAGRSVWGRNLSPSRYKVFKNMCRDNGLPLPEDLPSSVLEGASYSQIYQQ